MRRSLLILLAAGLWAGTASAAEDRTQAPPPPSRNTEPARPRPDAARLSAEDKEVVENLELLESMEAAQDLDMLMELSKEDKDEGSPNP
ncbi:MAG: hypothetical protein ACJ8AT_08765 [Hyalangium sp.]|uniref:hypothetical protein n=1 Tax=Hyalangium sp. TaxID=2028555 RepID=UPI00389A35DC